MKFDQYLTLLAKKDGSDLYLSAGAPPSAKFHGQLKALEQRSLTPGEIREIADAVMTEDQRGEFEHALEMNLAHSIHGVGRFRVNIFKQRNAVSMVVRNIKTEIPAVDNLGLPPVLKKVIMAKRGLVLFVGATGSGKSTSLASLIDYRNSNSHGHIITIEDPIEFVHPHKGCIVNQREVGVDTKSYADALKNTLRQAPDVILIGEIRDRETMEHALAFAETGHLAISTLHANNANQALDRVINFFPEEKREQLLTDLSLNLQGFISQRLVPTADGKRCAAVEILLGSSRVRDLIARGAVAELKTAMQQSEQGGMQTFDTALFKLYQEGRISLEHALKNADSETDLKLKIKLDKKGVDLGSMSGLSLQPTEEEKEEAEADGPAVFTTSPTPGG